MMRLTPCRLLALTLLSAAPALAAGPGFDCAKAARQIDKAICAWETVSVHDGRMADAFKATLAALKGEAAIAAVKATTRHGLPSSTGVAGWRMSCRTRAARAG
ncbi:hypothetical protein [Bosea sp. (in: a-proteobacteria)]